MTQLPKVMEGDSGQEDPRMVLWASVVRSVPVAEGTFWQDHALIVSGDCRLVNGHLVPTRQGLRRCMRLLQDLHAATLMTEE